MKTMALDRLSCRLAVLWALALISLPVADRLSAATALSCSVTLCVLTHAGLVVAVLRAAWGWRSTLAAAGAVYVIAWAAETVGLSTDFPFGSYSYTHGLGAQVGGVPVVIPASWLMMLVPAWGVAARLVGTERRLAFVAVSAPVDELRGLVCRCGLHHGGCSPPQPAPKAARDHLHRSLGRWIGQPVSCLALAGPCPLRLHRHGRFCAA